MNMILKSYSDVQNVLIFIMFGLSVYGIFSILKWFIGITIRNRRIFKTLGTFKSPPHIPIFGHTLEIIFSPPSNIHNKFFRICNAYGPDFVGWLFYKVFVVVGKPENVEKVLTSQSCLEKNEMYRALQMVMGTGLVTAPVEKWRHTRKMINPTFNTKVLEGYQQIFASCTSTLINDIIPKNLGKGKADWYSLFVMLNTDILLQSSLGVDHDIQRKRFDISKSIEVCLQSMFIRALYILYQPDFIFYRLGIGKSLLKNRQTLWNYVETIIQERKRKFHEDQVNNKCQSFIEDDSTVSRFKKPFLDCLLELDHKGMNFTDQDLKDEVTTFFMAGTDTTSITECFFLTMMGMHPDIQERVHEEARTVFGSNSNPSMQDLRKLEYLDRCLKESLRLFPTIPAFLRENTGDDLKLSDGVIPKGVSIAVNVLFIHRSELYWVDPLKYDPDRFLPDQIAKRHPYTYIPFSGGLRGCIGQKYAYNVIKTTLGLLLSKYRVHCDAYKSVEEIKLTGSIDLKPAKGFEFWFEKRESTS